MDNQAAIAMSKNFELHKKTKHIGVRFHRIRQEQEAGNVNVIYISSDKQVADMLTKYLLLAYNFTMSCSNEDEVKDKRRSWEFTSSRQLTHNSKRWR